VPVAAIATGLMLISRRCLLRLIEQAGLPVVAKHPVTGGDMHEFFKSQIVNGRHVGEDDYFCDLVRRHGGEVWGCPWIAATHTGQYTYTGDLKRAAKYVIQA
jgi:hypothetical protein